jgi:catechol 2,3-dioxygenase-like lactoylglutathione lyase family enzyme
VLGLKEIPKPEELRARGGAWFEVGALQFHIGVDPDPWPKSKRHVCFLVADLAKARAAVAAHGVSVEEEGFAEGLSRFFIRDPAGNRLEIGQR